MAITMMCSPETEGAVPVKHYAWNGDKPLYVHTTHAGLVLDLGEVNGYDDSDFYAVVWNEEKGAPERVTYASTRGWTYANGASIDATPEIVAKYEAWKAAAAARARAAYEAAEAAKPAKGKMVRVVRGRKVPVGTEGTVIWYGPDKFGGGYRVGLKLANGETAFTAAGNVEVLPAPWEEEA